MYIDPELETQRSQDPERRVDVILTCAEYSPALEKALEQMGFHTNTRQPDAKLLCGTLRLADLDALGTVRGVSSVELDTIQRIQDTASD
jgi:hypothetical protein